MNVYDATSSWSGFQYQGKIAIYKVINIINKMIQNGREEDIEKYELELENLEDFAIIFDKNYSSAHQVKAYNGSNTINDYLDAIINLYENEDGIMYNLHVSKKIDNWSLEGLRNTLNTRILNLNRKISRLSQEKQAEIEQLTLEVVEYQRLLDESEQILAKVNLYRYPNDDFHCELDQIENVIREGLRQYYSLTNQEEQMGSIAIEACYINLIGKIDGHVRDRHLKRASKRISFIEIRNKLDSNLSERDENFHVYVIKEKFCHKFKDEYCLRCQSLRKVDCFQSDDDHCFLLDLMKDIHQMSLVEFHEFIKKINPQIRIERIDDFSREDYLQKNWIQFFYKIIIDANKLYEIDNKKLTYKGLSGIYLPTTISSNGVFKEADEEDYCKIICKNNNLLVELYESNVFITNNVDRENIFETYSDVEEIDEDIRKEIERNNEYNIFSKVVSLKNRVKALGELNDE